MSGIIGYSIINEPTPKVIGTNNFASVEEQNASKDMGEKLVEVKVTFKNKEESDITNGKVKATYTLPRLFLEDKEYTVLNNEIESNARSVFATLKKPMIDSVESNYEFIVTNKVYDEVLKTKQIVSMVVTDKMLDQNSKKTTYLKVKSYNFNVTNREDISSKEAALEIYGVEYKTKVEDSINAHLISRSMKKVDNDKYIYSGLENWYIQEGQMHIVLNPGEAVAEKFGVVDVAIPLS